MEPEVVNIPEMTFVGIIGCGSDVSQIEIAGLWQRFDQHRENIKHQVEQKSYELHIQEETNPPMHFCLVGVEVQRIDHLPAELFVKVIPACEYAVFTHHFKEGGFSYAFKMVYKWLRNSDYTSAYPFDIQCYDTRFISPDDPESVVEIYIPIKSNLSPLCFLSTFNS